MVKSGSERSTECGAGTRSATPPMTSILSNPLLARIKYPLQAGGAGEQARQRDVQQGTLLSRPTQRLTGCHACFDNNDVQDSTVGHYETRG